jgi:Choline dehydrogenase and related flavoproteins
MGGARAAGWGWNDVLPYYRKLENDLDFGGDMHGRSGPVPIRRTSRTTGRRCRRRYMRSRKSAKSVHRRHECGFPRRLWRGADEQLAGQARVGGDLLSRCFGASARKSDHRQWATVTALLFEGRRVSGVTAKVGGGEVKRFHAREIILSTGGVHSPAFLMRSGIGPAGHLREHGIEVRADLPGVGENLSNHAIVFVGLLQNRNARQAASCGRIP